MSILLSCLSLMVTVEFSRPRPRPGSQRPSYGQGDRSRGQAKAKSAGYYICLICSEIPPPQKKVYDGSLIPQTLWRSMYPGKKGPVEGRNQGRRWVCVHSGIFKGGKGALPYPCGELTNMHTKQGLPSWIGEY